MIVTLLNEGDTFGENIVYAARTCYSSYSTQNEDSDRRLLKHLVRNDESPLEFATFRFEIQGISRACSHQLVRHRMSSLAQKSQRYVSEEQFDYVIPPSVVELTDRLGLRTLSVFKDCMLDLQSTYRTLREMGVKKEDARFILPNACATDIIYQANLRSLRNFWNLRLKPAAQWEIKDIALRTLKLVHGINPDLTVTKDGFFESVLEQDEK